MKIGVPRETYPGERRVALVPAVIPGLLKAGFEVVVEAGAGTEAAFPDADSSPRAQDPAGLAPRFSRPPISSFRCSVMGRMTAPATTIFPSCGPDHVLVGFLRPLGSIETIREVAARGVTSFAVELMPRTTRAQSMDALTSMATIAGYKAVVIGADKLPRIFPDADHGGGHDHARRASS